MKEQVVKFIENHNLGIISLVEDGKPYAAPIYYLFDSNDGSFDFICAVNTKKFDLIKKDSNVFITIVDEEKQQQVSVSGLATVLDESLSGKFKMLAKKLNDSFEVKVDIPLFNFKGSKKLVHIVPKEIRYRVYNGSDSDYYELKI